MRRKHGGPRQTLVERARELRKNPTPAERLLWEQLRGRRFLGLKFRRQHPFGLFILDFFCVERRLAIEVDGAAHEGESNTARDEERSAWLRQRGVRTVRISNDDILHDLEESLRRIGAAAATPPLPAIFAGEGAGG